jgi:hypothetical protein
MVLLAVSALACKGSGGSPPAKSLAEMRADSAHTAAGVQTQGTPELAPEAKVALDSGNALFRKKAYTAALAQYRLASMRSPRHAAPYFGIYMVAQATKNTKLADSALANIRANNGVPPMPGFDHSDTIGAKARAGVKKGPIK